MENGDLEVGNVDTIEDTIQTLLARVRNEGTQTHLLYPRAIHMAPDKLRELSPDSFIPRMVSIGPVHRDNKNVQAFELKKLEYLIDLITRVGSQEEETLRSCVHKAYSLMQHIRECYIGMRIYSDVEFVNMMVIDACFILEFINSISRYDKSYRGNMLPYQSIIYDLVLLENQIPFVLLEEIFECTILKINPNASIVEYFYPLLNLLNIYQADIKIENISYGNPDHILGLLQQCYQAPHNNSSLFLTSTTHSVVDLDRAGVNFKPYKDPKWLLEMDVKICSLSCFSWCGGGPTLRMPVLHIHGFTELVLRNLIAYEQSCQYNLYITSYAFALRMLVNTHEDVTKLVDSRVLVNDLGSNEETANMINNICKTVARVNFFYDEEWKILNKYCDGYWPKHIAWLKRTYFNSPWNIIALFAGIILFALTVVQTIFTIQSAKSNKLIITVKDPVM